jgi:Peptidase C13 family.
MRTAHRRIIKPVEMKSYHDIRAFITDLSTCNTVYGSRVVVTRHDDVISSRLELCAKLIRDLHGKNILRHTRESSSRTRSIGKERIKSIVAQMDAANMYRRMMFSIETCFSGQWGEALTGQPDVIVLTAANPRETSKADMHNPELGVFLSNAFARTFRQYVNQDNNISLRDLYIELAKTTNGSHVSIYNEQNYGSVYTNTMRDFFPE